MEVEMSNVRCSISNAKVGWSEQGEVGNLTLEILCRFKSEEKNQMPNGALFRMRDRGIGGSGMYFGM